MVTVWGLDWNIISFITASAVNCLAPVDSLVIKSASYPVVLTVMMSIYSNLTPGHPDDD